MEGDSGWTGGTTKARARSSEVACLSALTHDLRFVSACLGFCIHRASSMRACCMLVFCAVPVTLGWLLRVLSLLPVLLFAWCRAGLRFALCCLWAVQGGRALDACCDAYDEACTEHRVIDAARCARLLPRLQQWSGAQALPAVCCELECVRRVSGCAWLCVQRRPLACDRRVCPARISPPFCTTKTTHSELAAGGKQEGERKENDGSA